MKFYGNMTNMQTHSLHITETKLFPINAKKTMNKSVRKKDYTM